MTHNETLTPQQKHGARSLVLASGSPYRRQQLEGRLGLAIQALLPECDETPLAGESPREMSLRLSLNKARSVAKRIKDGPLVIAGDQTAEFDSQLLRKPGNHANAITQLKWFSGREICFYSGLCVYDTCDDTYLLDTVETRVTFRTLAHSQIEYYVAKDRPFDCVGAFKNEQLGIALFEAIESRDPSALTGLPLIRLCSMLQSFDYEVLFNPAIK